MDWNYLNNGYIVNPDAPLTEEMYGLVEKAVKFARATTTIGTFYGGVTRIKRNNDFALRNPQHETTRIEAKGLQFADFCIIRDAVEFVKHAAVTEFHDGYFTVTV